MRPGTRYQIAPRKSAVLTLDADNRRIAAELVSCQGRELRLQLAENVPDGATVRVHLDGGLVLGTATGCRITGRSRELSIRIDQVIPETTDLARLVSAVLGQHTPVTIYNAALDSAMTVPAHVHANIRNGTAR